MKKYYFLLLFILPVIGAKAQTRTTVQNGNATNPLTWDCTCIPVPGNNIVINHTLTLDTDFGYSTGSVTINAGGAMNGNSPARILAVNGGTFTNNGSVDIAYIYHGGGTFTNNTTIAIDHSFGTNLTAITTNNGTINIVDTLGVNTNAGFVNGGTITASVYAIAGNVTNTGSLTGGVVLTSGTINHNSGTFSVTDVLNSGTFNTQVPASVSNDFWNSENVDINHNLNIGHSLYTGDTTGGPATFTNDGLISVATDFLNSKTMNGTGRFCVGGITTNSGAISGTLDICDQTGGAIDFNSGTVAGTVTYCATSCNVAVQEEKKDEYGVTVYPNPFENTFEIRTNKARSYSLLLVNAIGQQVMQMNFSSSLVKLDASNLPEGIYFYRLSVSDSLVSTGRLVKR